MVQPKLRASLSQFIREFAGRFAGVGYSAVVMASIFASLRFGRTLLHQPYRFRGKSIPGRLACASRVIDAACLCQRICKRAPFRSCFALDDHLRRHLRQIPAPCRRAILVAHYAQHLAFPRQLQNRPQEVLSRARRTPSLCERSCGRRRSLPALVLPRVCWLRRRSRVRSRPSLYKELSRSRQRHSPLKSG